MMLPFMKYSGSNVATLVAFSNVNPCPVTKSILSLKKMHVCIFLKFILFSTASQFFQVFIS